MTTMRATATPGDPVAGGSRARSWRVGGILAAVIALIALAGWLLWPSPPGHLVRHTGTADHIVTVTLDSSRMGDTGVDIDLTDRAGHAVDGALVTVQAVEPRMGYSDPPGTASGTGSGRYHVPDVPFMMTGPWNLQVSIVAGGGTDRLSVPLWIGG